MILQVRPIAVHKNERRVAESDFAKMLDAIKTYLGRKLDSASEALVGTNTAFGVMPDWNPAEIIGVSPKPLALSLYKELITDHVWPSSRAHIGYRNVDHNFGMVALGGRPYIDLRVSLNTLTPASLNDDLATRLIDFYIDYLEENKNYHDKIEFDVALTTYSFDIAKLEFHLSKGGFSLSETGEIIESLRLLTKNILENSNLEIDSFMSDLLELEVRQQRLAHSEDDVFGEIYTLIRDCKTFGTFQFSILARYAFISNVLLKSLVSVGVISTARYEEFFASVSTIPKMLIRDLSVLDIDKLNKKYGHLRPGTYDVESRNYRESNCLLDGMGKGSSDGKGVSFEWSRNEEESIVSLLDIAGIDISFQKFANFLRSAIEAREFSKFIFTKSIDEVLDRIVGIGSDLGISRKDISFLNIKTVLGLCGTSHSSNLKGEFLSEIQYNEKQFLLTHSLKLPPLIFSSKDVDIHLIESEEPNFVTNAICVAPIEEIGSDTVHGRQLTGKIVVIEKADPGFDWIFSHDIKGLITLYGGVASHMAIRCAELGLPAAIGCGTLIYKFVQCSQVVELDCSSRQIRRVT